MSKSYVKGNEVFSADNPIAVLRKVASEMTPRYSRIAQAAQLYTGPFRTVVVLLEATFTWASVAGKPDPTAGTHTALPAGTILYGEYTSITLASGELQLYNL